MIKNKSNMTIILLASNPQLYSNQRLMSAAEKRGHEIKFVNTRGDIACLGRLQEDFEPRRGEPEDH